MSDMGLVIVGAGGRMGQTLVRAVHAMPGARLAGAIERAGSPHLGRDAGELPGIGIVNVPITDDPLTAFAKADGVIDFTAPAASVEFAGYAAQARIVHVIGTTGFSAEHDAAVAAAARHATIVKSGNMSLGVNLLAELVRNADSVLTRKMLYEKVWQFDDEPAAKLVDAYVSRLRRRIAAQVGDDPIVTVRGLGYMVRA